MRRVLLLVTLLTSPLPAIAQTPQQLASQAEAAYKAKQYPESAQLYVEALHATDNLDPANLSYNAACSFALAHNPQDAFLYLNRAINEGDLDRDHISTDTDLLSLHPDTRWPKTLARIDAILSAEKRHWSATAFDTPLKADLTEAEKVAGLSELWAEARYGFANFWHVPDLDWDAAYFAFLPQVTATKSTFDYYRVLIRFYALLQDGHTNVYYPESIYPDRLALRTRLVDGHVLVVGSRAAGSDTGGINVGDELIAIDGQPVKAYAAQAIAPYVSASSAQDRDTRTYDYNLLSSPAGSRLTLETQDASGRRSSHVFTVSEIKPTHPPAFELHMLPGNIAHIILNSFEDDSAAKAFDEHFAEISKARAVILDLRENGGGSDSVGWHILSAFMEKPVPSYRSASPRYVATYRAWGQAQTPRNFPQELLPPDPKRHFAVPVVLLTSPRTFSAGEDLAVVFSQSHRGKIIGEPTGGSTGQPLSFKLPGGGSARVCTKHDSFADGSEFVGVGVKPDIPAAPTVDDIRHHRDAVLERALSALESRP